MSAGDSASSVISVFILLGFKTPEEAHKAQKYFNNTYMGTSKVQVEFAMTKDELLAPKEKYPKKHKNFKDDAKVVEEPQNKKKFDEYKELIQKGSKQSWNDLLVGEDVVVEQPKKQVKKNKQ